MPELKMISPLLDNIIAGDAISDHDGIRCYPAMHEITNQKYILKVISVPASQTKFDALLLAGALKNEDEGNRYFEERVKEFVSEIEALQQLSRQEGFLPCVGYQAAPKDEGVGFDLYILSEYKRSLQRQSSKKPLSQLDALNLGLDICSALTACRRNGYLFTNLKPSNIYMSPNGEYRISDFGLINIKNLSYAILPDHYIGPYTPPEIVDPFSSLNETMDVYALGMILYEIFNGGALPQNKNNSFPVPAYADEELSQIIMKAISVDPQERWRDPTQMGQMLVNYMQKNGANDIPIIPPASVPENKSEEELQDDTLDTASEDISLDDMIEIIDSIDASVDNHSQIEEIQSEQDIPKEMEQLTIPMVFSEDTHNEDTEISNSTTETEISSSDSDILTSLDVPEVASDSICVEESCENITSEDVLPVEIIAEESCESAENTTPIDDNMQTQNISEENEIDTTTEISSDISSDASYASVLDDSPYEGISEEVSQILSQADALVDLTVPDPVVTHAPEEINPEAPVESDHFEQAEENIYDNTEETKIMKTDELISEEIFSEEPKKRQSHWLRNTIIILVLLLALVGGFLFYKFYVLKTISQFQITNSGDSITVLVASDADEAQLSVSCTDQNKTVTGQVKDGRVVFDNLAPSTKYKISLNISGLHILKGYAPKEFTTPAETTIVQHEVKVGDVAGTVEISFAVNGPDSERWTFTYQAAGIEPKTEPVVGNSFTLKGLKEGVAYKGILTPEKDLLITEPLEIVFSASELIQASDLRIVSCSGGSLSAQWKAPESVEVESWFVRCYNDNYDETLSGIKGTTATFNNLNSSESFTVEVWAKDQTIRQSVKIEDNSITVKDLSADLASAGRITLTWKTSAAAQGGWIVTYNVNDSETFFERKVSENKLVIDPVAPGAKYTFTVKAADPASTTFCDEFSCVVPSVEGTLSLTINDKVLTSNDIQISMCKRPGTNSWTSTDLSDAHYTHNFKSSDKAGFLFFLKDTFQEADQILNIAVVVQDEDGGLVTISSESETWNAMWNQNYYSLNIPDTPNKIGYYVATIYINNMYVAEFDFVVS